MDVVRNFFAGSVMTAHLSISVPFSEIEPGDGIEQILICVRDDVRAPGVRSPTPRASESRPINATRLSKSIERRSRRGIPLRGAVRNDRRLVVIGVAIACQRGLDARPKCSHPLLAAEEVRLRR